jgi:hypothetical protein
MVYPTIDQCRRKILLAKGLLFAGSEEAVYVSFDRWETAKLEIELCRQHRSEIYYKR